MLLQRRLKLAIEIRKDSVLYGVYEGRNKAWSDHGFIELQSLPPSGTLEYTNCFWPNLARNPLDQISPQHVVDVVVGMIF